MAFARGFVLPLLWISLLPVAAAPAVAADLLQVYREALGNDPVYASARAGRDAGVEAIPQGRAQILPTLNLINANTTSNRDNVSFRGVLPDQLRKGNTNGYLVQLTQPLFKWDAFQLYKEGEFKAAQAEATFGQAAQDLIVRVAQAYFDVLASQDSLTFTSAQKAAIAEQLAQAKRNFEVGTATITDTHEAQARFDRTVSDEIAAQSDLEIKKRTLQQIIGKLPDPLLPLKHNIELYPPKPDSMEEWAAAAETRNFPVIAQQANLEVTQREIERSRAGHLPSLSVVGSVQRSNQGISVSGLTNIPIDSDNTSVALVLTVPLYAGGSVNSQVRQAFANRDKAQQDLETARRAAALNARQSYLGVTNGMAQVKALEAALVSSQSALDSNKLGYEVGVRINIDVLNAQQQLYQTLRDLAVARYNTVLNGLKLKAAAGALSESDVEEVNRLLGRD